jgi:hypothetical protein
MYRLALFALVACSQTVPPKPTSPTSRGLRADQHLDAAREHARRADELARWPAARLDDSGFDDPGSGTWYRGWDQTAEQRRLEDVHRSEAARLHAAFDEACAGIDPKTVRVSPLVRHGIGGMNVDNGVVVFLPATAGAPDRLLAELRCHRAWMMLSENTGMDACPLDLPGLRVQAHGDASGISIELRVRDPRLVPEIQRRAAHDLEMAAQQRAAL